MYPVLLSIGKVKLYSFGSFIAIGAILGGMLMFRLAKARKIKTAFVFDAVLYSVVLGLLGARVGYYFAYQEQFQSFWQIIYFWQGGLLAISGLIVGFLTFLYIIRRQDVPVWSVLDISGLSLLLGWAVGEFGCNLASCSIGRATESFLAVNGAFPIDLILSIWTFVIFTALLYTWIRNSLSDGVIFFLALEGLFLGELVINTLQSTFGETLARTEAMVYLALIVLVYLVFWRLHGPKIQKGRFGLFLKNLVFRKR
ncbi:hypothetical protein A2807_02540 [Candidatus Berkelbacteria bacterium RIFCSPHIGHO2_01_FULL_50_36]|nr:MAG: hypothetical protein A2807_02540 [Candidatus Berkelbacteria bacterium RIFCSPHIGHO2_01_FULL_50_36]OGD62677.1 MAG: hypothetical protein A3F39_00555 [Candidatus Berkelbacteria bacterium RIFCSPHIGHO2_12_FULL_50_11]